MTPEPVPEPAGRARRGAWQLALFGRASAGALRALGWTWRIEVVGPDPRERPETAAGPHLAALWHEALLPTAYVFRDRAYTVAVSRSRDGDLITSALLRLGYTEPPRGSSSRGGAAALRGLTRVLGEGTTVSVLVDGPRGPARVPKPGVIALARLAGVPITPVAFAARPALRLSSWDRSLVPLPFARVVCAFGEPIDVPAALPADAQGPDVDETEAKLLAELEASLRAVAGRAADRLDRGRRSP